MAYFNKGLHPAVQFLISFVAILLVLLGLYCLACGFASWVTDMSFAEAFTTFFGASAAAPVEAPTDGIIGL